MFAEQQKQVKKDIKKSDIVILSVGANDLFAVALTEANNAMAGTLDTTKSKTKRELIEKTDALVQKYIAKGQFEKAWSTIIATAKTLNMVGDVLDVLSEAFTRGYINYVKNWNTIATKVHKLNPDAKFIVISVFNGMQGMRVIQGMPIGIGNALDPFVNGMNEYTQLYNATRNYYTYIDSTDADRPTWPTITEAFADNQFNAVLMTCTHLTPLGHQQVADKIIDALKG